MIGIPQFNDALGLYELQRQGINMREKHPMEEVNGAVRSKGQTLLLLLGLNLGIWCQVSYADTICIGDNATANFIQGTTSDDLVASAMNWNTGLVWRQCSVESTGEICDRNDTVNLWIDWNNRYAPLVYSGTPATVTTNRLASGAWRLPYVNELLGLMSGCSSSSPGSDLLINKTVFPRSTDYGWSASRSMADDREAWGVNFGLGRSYSYNKAFAAQVRLVRSGQSFSSFSSSDNQSQSAAAASQATFPQTSLKAPVGTTAWGGARISGDGSPEFQVNGRGAWVTQAIVQSTDRLSVRMTAAGNKGNTGTARLTLRSGQTMGETTDTRTWGNGATTMSETIATFKLTSTGVTQNITNPSASPALPVYAPNGTFIVSATAGASNSALHYSSQTPSVCTVPDATNNNVTTQGAGDCIIAFDQAGVDNYDAAPQVTLTVPIAKAAQSISNAKTTPASPVYASGGTFQISATGGLSTSPVTFSSTSTGVCTTGSSNGSIVTMVSAGTCNLSVRQAGDNNYDAAPSVAKSVLVGLGTQTIQFTSSPPTTPKVGTTYAVTTKPGPSTQSVTLSAMGSCTLQDSTVNFDAVGTCTITANQDGDANYAAAVAIMQTVQIVQGDSGVSITATPNPSLPGQEVTFTITVALDLTKSLKAQSGLTKAAAVPTGTVTLTDGTTTLGTTTLDASGNATFMVRTLTLVGAHSIVASYSGDANFPAFQSAAFIQTVSAVPVATPVPLVGELWEKLLLSLMLVSVSALLLRMRRA